ncbi:MAG TPA: polysaccharide biosynthesis/export family protein, partial [Pyrinomonadaceae bacterium]|nr:polysaccharide biosynthesis/export family protein [Pyrinomonadaceae bacterium]
LLNANSRESTLFTVMPGGLLEYPLAGEPLQVAGLTTDEIAARLTEKIKLYDDPEVAVGVREYASHSVIVTGLVNDPGTKFLRREAVPLYVLLAEAQPRPEAGRAVLMREGEPSITIDLSDPQATLALVQHGDVIIFSAPPKPAPQFFFIGGQVNSPGQKEFHAGLTLTQAILASGGVSRLAGHKVKISRQGADGRLVSTEYNLKQIDEGKVPDPLLQPGDRLEVGRGRW